LKSKRQQGESRLPPHRRRRTAVTQRQTANSTPLSTLGKQSQGLAACPFCLQRPSHQKYLSSSNNFPAVVALQTTRRNYSLEMATNASQKKRKKFICQKLGRLTE